MVFIMRKPVFGVSDQVQHNWAIQPKKMALDVCSKNHGVDQLHGYHTADLRLCFSHMHKQVFS